MGTFITGPDALPSLKTDQPGHAPSGVSYELTAADFNAIWAALADTRTAIALAGSSSGVVNTLALFTGTHLLGNSSLTQDASGNLTIACTDSTGTADSLNIYQSATGVGAPSIAFYRGNAFVGSLVGNDGNADLSSFGYLSGINIKAASTRSVGVLVGSATILAVDANGLRITGTPNSSSLSIRSGSPDSGGYFTTTGPDELFMSSGAAYVSGTWVAKAGTGGIAGLSTGIYRWYLNSGLSAGYTYTPTLVMQLFPGGALTVAGQVTSSSGGFRFPDGTVQPTAALGSSANAPSTFVVRDTGGNLSAGTITASLIGSISGSAANFTGSMAGDVTGTQSATVVVSVAGSTAANVHAAELLASAATSANTASTIVKRDGSGGVALGSVTFADATVQTTATASLGLSAVGSSPNANAATVTSGVLNLQPASAAFPGVVTTGAQTLAGAKTFASTITSGATTGVGLQMAVNTTISFDPAASMTIQGDQFSEMKVSAAGGILMQGGPVNVRSPSFAVATDYDKSLAITGAADPVRVGAASAYGNFATLKVYGHQADSATAVGVILDNDVALATSGAKIISVRNNAVEKMSVDKAGKGACVGVTSSALIESTTGGFKFPDGTTQTTASAGGGGGGTASASGTANTVGLFTGASALGNSSLTQVSTGDMTLTSSDTSGSVNTLSLSQSGGGSGAPSVGMTRSGAFVGSLVGWDATANSFGFVNGVSLKAPAGKQVGLVVSATTVAVADGTGFHVLGGNSLSVGQASQLYSARVEAYGATSTSLVGVIARGSQSGAGGAQGAFGHPYLWVGGREFNAVGDLYTLGFGWHDPTTVYAQVEIGYRSESVSGSEHGAFVIATRSGDTDSAPTERAAFNGRGALLLGTTTDTGTALLQVNGAVLRSGKNIDSGATDASGTPGASTQNSATGKSAIAAGASSVTITNSMCLAGSLARAWVQQASADATLLRVERMSVSAGSFTVYGNASATAATVIAWEVLN